MLKFPLLAVLGDTESHDRLCGRYNMCGVNTARLCRHCDTPTLKTASVDYPWRHILPSDISLLLLAGDYVGLKGTTSVPLILQLWTNIGLFLWISGVDQI